MQTVPITDGWSVRFDAPTLEILDDTETVRFTTDQWNPNLCDPIADALAWASAIADPDSGLTVEYDDDPAFTASVVYVRTHAPQGFADECSTLSEEAEEANAS